MHRSVSRVPLAFVLGGAATLALASCSVLGVAGQPSATPVSTEVVDPSVATPEPTDSASASPAPTDVPPVTPSAAPTASASASMPSARAAVVPFITSASWDTGSKSLVASAIVPKVVEQGGICTLTATRSGTTRSVSAAAGPGAQYTGCGALALPGSKLGAGSWTVTVSYESAKHRGTSAARTVTVGG